MSRIHSYTEGINSTSFHAIDQHAAETPMENIFSEDGLIQYLEDPIDKDDQNRNIYLARAILVFLSEINIARNTSTYEVLPSLQEIIYGKTTTSFHKLCCEAGMEVQIITGMMKSSNYKPGVTNIENLKRGQWCAFKSGETWHIVHPQWAVLSMYGFGAEGHILAGKGVSDKRTGSRSYRETLLHAFNDFWFCIKPEVFIHHCFSDDRDWQLLSQPYKTVDEFLSLPFLQQGYYEAGLKLLTEQTCLLSAANGVCIISFAENKKLTKYIEFTYTLSLLQGDHSTVKQSDLGQLVMTIPSEEVYSFRISLPVIGEYSFEVMVIADDIVSNASCADFRIICDEACKNCKEVPRNVGVEGFGFGNEAKTAGLKHPSHPLPVMVLHSPDDEFASNCEDDIIQFHIDSDRVNEMEFTSDVIGDIEQTAVHTDAYVDGRKGKLIVKTKTTKSADFTLQVKAREKKTGADFKPVLNYMCTTNIQEKELYGKHEKDVKQRKRSLTKEEKIADKTRKKSELIRKIKDLESQSRRN